jgi:hypothetical protein
MGFWITCVFMVLDSLSGADRAQLHELYARSVMLLEFGRIDQWAELFEPQATLRCFHTKGESVVQHQFKGRDELLSLGLRIVNAQFDVALGAIESTSRCRHLLSNVCFFEEGLHGASGYAYVLVTSVSRTEPRWLASGVYFDRLTKCGSGCWRFASRSFTADGANTVESLDARTTHLATPFNLKPSAA